MGANPAEIANCSDVLTRIASVAESRSRSPKLRTREWTDYPSLFSENRQPKVSYTIIPKVSSSRRDYVPIGELEPDVIVSGSAQFIAPHDPFTFAVVISRMHMCWLDAVGGRTKSDYQYTNTLVYNTFPWATPTDAQRAKVAALSDVVLAARANHPISSLAILYNPLTMPADLRTAHSALDRAVDRLYRPEPFASDRDRVEHLFTRYAALVDPLLTAGAKANARTARRVRNTK